MSFNLNPNEEENRVNTENDLEEIDINDMEIQNEEQISNNSQDNSKHNHSKNNIKNTDTNEEPIYVMTLALDQGKSEKIEIFSNSDPSELAYNFCRRNNLDFNALDYLREQITNLLETYAKNENENENDEEENDNNEEDNETINTN